MSGLHTKHIKDRDNARIEVKNSLPTVVQSLAFFVD